MSWREPAKSDLAALSVWVFVRTRLTQQRQVSRFASWRLHKRKPAHTVVLRTRNQPKSTLELKPHQSISGRDAAAESGSWALSTVTYLKLVFLCRRERCQQGK